MDALRQLQVLEQGCYRYRYRCHYQGQMMSMSEDAYRRRWSLAARNYGPRQRQQQPQQQQRKSLTPATQFTSSCNAINTGRIPSSLATPPIHRPVHLLGVHRTSIHPPYTPAADRVFTVCS